MMQDIFDIEKNEKFLLFLIKTTCFEDFDYIKKIYTDYKQTFDILFCDVILLEPIVQKPKYFIQISNFILRIGEISLHIVTIMEKKKIIGMFVPMSSLISWREISNIFLMQSDYIELGFRGAQTFHFKGIQIENPDLLWSDIYTNGGEAIILKCF